MAIDVITHGGGEGLVYAFNAVASLFNGKKALGASLVYMASCFAVVLMSISMIAKQELLPTAKWFFGTLIITSALMLPKIDVIVKDRITRLEQPVAHVPFMLGFFAGFSSQLGDILAKQLDAIFSKAGPDYRGNGVAMASQLLSKVNHFHIRDPLMASNVRGFVQQCMVFDIAKGKYTIKELHRSDNIWTLLKSNASEARGFVYKIFQEKQEKGKKPITSKIVTCKEAADLIEKDWESAYKQAALAYGPRLYPSHANPNKLFMENLPIAHRYLTTLSNSAESILQQSMMSNAIDDGLLELNQLTDANAAVTAYAAKRAQAQQRVAYSLQGSMASLSLSILKIVVEILFFGLFPIIVAIAIFPGGWIIIKKYLIALFWIQSWAPLYSILNMIMNVYAKTKSMAAISIIGKGALNIYSLKGLNEANEWITSVAGYAMMSVPFLSYGIIHYGAGALSQLATHFGSVTQSAASHAAEEATTGNYSMGNTTFDSHNRHNISGFKQDTNPSIATNRATFQRQDGSQISRNIDGSPVYNRAGSLSEFGGNIKISDQLVSSLNESANESIQTGKTESFNTASNLSAALNTLEEFRKNRGSDKNLGTTFSAQEQAFKESAFSKYSDLVKSFADDHKMEVSTADELFGEIGARIPGTRIGGGVKFSKSHVDRDTVSEAESYADKNNMSELLKSAFNEAKEGRLALTDSEGKNYGKAISSNLSRAASHVDSAQAHFSKAESYQKQATQISQNSLGIDQDFSNQYFKALVQEQGSERATAIVSDPNLNYKMMQKFVDTKKQELMQQFENQKPTNVPKMEQKFQHEKSAIAQGLDMDAITSANQGIVSSNIQSEGLAEPISTELKTQVENSLQQAKQDIEEQKQALERKKEDLMNRPKHGKTPIDQLSIFDLPLD